MASLDFDSEKAAFKEYYTTNRDQLERAKETLLALIRSIIDETDYAGSVVTGRVKDLKSAIDKFSIKYRDDLERNETSYEIKDHITDLIGLRIVCLYEDDIEPIGDIFRETLTVLDVTDKVAKIEATENEFGYKGLHLDLRLDDARAALRGNLLIAPFRFELQIRTIVQDSWSTLDHKIKYKKSIPNSLKRRINTLAALFELADREFRYIRDATAEGIRVAATEDNTDDSAISGTAESATAENTDTKNFYFAKLDAFRFLRIAHHFFPNYDFEPEKADGFTSEVIRNEPSISRGKFNYYIREYINIVRQYREYVFANGLSNNFNPFTEMRHCLYAAAPELFASILTARARKNFEAWQKGPGSDLMSEARARKRPKGGRNPAAAPR